MHEVIEHADPVDDLDITSTSPYKSCRQDGIMWKGIGSEPTCVIQPSDPILETTPSNALPALAVRFALVCSGQSFRKR